MYKTNLRLPEHKGSGGQQGIKLRHQWLKKKKNRLTMQVDARDAGSISGLGRCPEDGNGNPRQYSCLENPIDRGAW